MQSYRDHSDAGSSGRTSVRRNRAQHGTCCNRHAHFTRSIGVTSGNAMDRRVRQTADIRTTSRVRSLRFRSPRRSGSAKLPGSCGVDYCARCTIAMARITVAAPHDIASATSGMQVYHFHRRWCRICSASAGRVRVGRGLALAPGKTTTDVSTAEWWAESGTGSRVWRVRTRPGRQLHRWHFGPVTRRWALPTTPLRRRQHGEVDDAPSSSA